jgi:tyrosinase
MRVRNDVYQLQPADQTLAWYAKAVGYMKTLPRANPRSWEYQAAVHGIAPLPPNMAAYWAQCQHGTSFFLPWHRMYVLRFERIVAMHIAELGGPSDWALPYWNYSAPDPAVLALPPAFRKPTQQDGSANPLFEPLRNPVANAGGQVLGSRDVDLKCLTAPGSTSTGGFFGGIPPDHVGGSGGALELLPHNAIHNRVGNVAGGLMQDPDLAALDPIFWLHHSNIDRLWDVWKDCDPAHQDLTSPYWRTGVKFQFFDESGTLVTMQTQDVLDTRVSPLEYIYQDATCPTKFKVAGQPARQGRASAAPTGGIDMSALERELVGATRTAVHLGGEKAEVSLPTPVTPRAFRSTRDRAAVPEHATAQELVQHVTLHLEQVTSVDVAPTYDVFLNVPEGEDPNKHEDRFIGRVSMFGIKQASDPNGPHGGGGQNFALDITQLYHQLAGLREFDASKLSVTFLPVSPIGTPHVTVGRISLYFE